MSGLFTNQFQAVVLFDGNKPLSPAQVLVPLRERLAEIGLPLGVTQEAPGFVLMTGAEDLHITVQYNDHPAEAAVMTPTLNSPFTGMMTPDAAERIRRHRSHALVEVRQGVLPDMPELSSFLDKIDMPKPGHSLAEFTMRMNTTAAICDDLIQAHGGTLVHWTPSNMLVAAERFRGMSQEGSPPMTMIHPRLFGADPVPGFKETPAGFYTLGAANYVGGEIHMMPAPIPWFELYDTAMAFIRFAIAEGGYIIPDGDTFGPDDDPQACRVEHIAACTAGIDLQEPHFRLTLLRSREHGYEADRANAPKPKAGGLGGRVRKGFGKRR